MVARLFLFVLCLAAGSAVGWTAAGAAGMTMGLVVGAFGWFVLDSSRALRVLHWLRTPEPGSAPRVGGLWGQAADRVRRMQGAGEKRAEEAQRRLETFLEAIRNSPNGVILLDAQGRIEWVNETGATHFGLDPRRDLQQHVLNLVRDPGVAQLFARQDAPRDLVVAARAAPHHAR